MDGLSPKANRIFCFFQRLHLRAILSLILAILGHILFKPDLQEKEMVDPPFSNEQPSRYNIGFPQNTRKWLGVS